MKKLIDIGYKFKSKQLNYIITVTKLAIGFVYFSTVDITNEIKISKSDFINTYDKYYPLE